MKHNYNNSFSETNVYGKAMQLLAEYRRRGDNLVHLDIGCGYGSIATHIELLGLTYVGVDVDSLAVHAVKEQGFEAHQVELTDEGDSLFKLTAVVGGRTLSSITILDTLEHVRTPLDVLRAIRALTADHQVPLIVSVPNVTHRENAAKMLAGRFEYTTDGLLDHTHIIHFSRDTLMRMTRDAGFVEIAQNDTQALYPDRDLHRDTEATWYEATWFSAVARIRAMAGNDATTYQFVRAYLPAPSTMESWYVDPSARVTRPFLSIIIRTTGRETFPLKDTLACLLGQSDHDFEVLLMGHRLDIPRQIEVEKVIEKVPIFLRERIKLVLVGDGNRTKPLNVGYGLARGRYIVTLDDDDLIFGHYVSSFRKLAESYSGRLLRVRCASQAARGTEVDGGDRAAISESAVLLPYPGKFNFVDHLHDNFTPCMSVAYPRDAFQTFNLSFDETLTTAEDYDLMMRAYALFGIGCNDQITCIYRRWTGRENSAVLHSAEEWQGNHARIIAKLDSMPILLTSDELGEIRRRTRSIPPQEEVTTKHPTESSSSSRGLVDSFVLQWREFKRHIGLGER